MVASIHLPKYTFIITLMNISRVKVVRVGGKGNLGCRKTLFFLADDFKWTQFAQAWKVKRPIHLSDHIRENVFLPHHLNP